MINKRDWDEYFSSEEAFSCTTKFHLYSPSELSGFLSWPHNVCQMLCVLPGSHGGFALRWITCPPYLQTRDWFFSSRWCLPRWCTGPGPSPGRRRERRTWTGRSGRGWGTHLSGGRAKDLRFLTLSVGVMCFRGHVTPLWWRKRFSIFVQA